MRIATIDNIPVFNAEIGENEGMLCVSLVDMPAVQSDFIRLNKDTKPQMFAIENEEKRRVLGVVMRADYPIYRNDPQHGEYYMVFKADTIRKMAQKYLADHYQNQIDLDHNGQMVKGVELVQWFIKDAEKGVNPNCFDGIADGSLFAEYQILDNRIWDAIKDGTYNGFSLEGYFSLMPERNQDRADDMAETYAGEFRAELKTIINKIDTMGNGRFKKFKEELNKVIAMFGAITTDKGILNWEGDEDLKVGDKVTIDNNGEAIAPENGEYKTEDGTIIVIEGGQVAEIREIEEEVEAPAEDPIPAEEAKKKPCKGEDEVPADAPAEEEPAEPQEDPLKEIADKVAALENRIAEWESRQQAIEDRLAVLEGKPADEPAEEKYKKAVRTENRAAYMASFLKR